MSEPVYGDRYSVPGTAVFVDVDRAEVLITGKAGERMFRVVNTKTRERWILTQELLEDPICQRLPKAK